MDFRSRAVTGSSFCFFLLSFLEDFLESFFSFLSFLLLLFFSDLSFFEDCDRASEGEGGAGGAVGLGCLESVGSGSGEYHIITVQEVVTRRGQKKNKK